MGTPSPSPDLLARAIETFTPRTRELGLNLTMQGAVRLNRLGEREVRATVQDQGPWQVQLIFLAGAVGTRCTCKKKTRCEHAFAVLMHDMVRGQQQQSVASPTTTAPAAAPKPIHKPPAAAAPAKPKSKAKSTPIAATPAQPAAQPEWHERLKSLRTAALHSAPGRERLDLTFVVDLDECRRHAHLDVSIQVAAAGTHRRRSLSSRDESGNFSEDAAELLRKIHLLAEERLFLDMPSSRQKIKEPWASDLMTQMFRVGEVVILEGSAKQIVKERRVSLDAGKHFALKVTSTEDATHRTLTGTLQRDEEAISASEVTWLTNHHAILLDRVVPVAIPASSRPMAQELLLVGPLVMPRAADHTVLPVLASLSHSVPELRTICNITDAEAPGSLLAINTTRQVAGHWLAELRFDYQDTVIPCDAPALLPAIQEGGPLRRRQIEAEHAAERHLRGAAMPHLLPTQMAGQFLLKPAALMPLVQQLTSAGIRTLINEHVLRTGTLPQIRVRSAIDWFELDGAVQFGSGGSLPLAQALASLERGEQVIKLADGSLAILPTADLAPFQKAARLGERHGDGLRVRRSQALLLDALLAARSDEATAVDAEFRSLCTRLSPRGGVPPQPAPKGFRGTLRPYQEIGLGWLHFLRELRLGGCLADDMGLGKTVQVLALLAEVHAKPQAKPTLLVAPRSLLDNWIREAQRFAPHLRVLDFHGSDRWTRIAERGFAEYDLIVTTYGTLRIDVARLEEGQQEFEYAILDEAQAIGNASSATSKAARLLRAEHRLALTGTPVMNHLGELWALFDFLSPGLLGRNATFQKLVRGERGGELDVALLQKALAPFLLRRTKATVLDDLPPKQEQDIWCEMDGSQLKTYSALRQRYQQALLGGDAGKLGAKEKFQVLEALLRLRQCACHEQLLDIAEGDGSAKFEALLPMLQELVEGGHKALVFSQFTELLGLLRPRLEAAGLKHEYLDGSTRDRQQRVDRFQQDPDCPLFLVSLKAGGTGLNLTAADYVFLLDPWWNPAAEAQATDRAHRIGQTRKVTVYRLITKGTVEARVVELQARKRELADAVLGADESLLAKLTREDLAALLG